LRGELAYFNATLGLFKSFPIQRWLEEYRIKPSQDTLYTVSGFQEAIRSQLKASVRLDCVRVAHKISPHPVLDTVYVCVNKQTLEPFDCPEDRNYCADGFIFPPLSD
jgi:hypothetical protein